MKTTSAEQIKNILFNKRKLSLLIKLNESSLKLEILFTFSLTVIASRYAIIIIKNNPLSGSVAKLCTDTIKFERTKKVPNTDAMKQ